LFINNTVKDFYNVEHKVKTYTYYQLPAVGPGKLKMRGSLIELLQSIPYLLTKNRLPPLNVLNDIFESGGVDAGMSGGSQWDPFSIAQQEYSDLVQQCKSLDLEISQAPAWVKNRIDFHIWEFELDHGVPSKKHKELSELENTATDRLNAALDSNASEEEINRLHLEAYEAGNALWEFLDDYIQTSGS